MPDMSIKDLLGTLPDEVAPAPEFASRLRSELERELANPVVDETLHRSTVQTAPEVVEMEVSWTPVPRSRTTTWWLFAAAAAAVVVLAGVLVFISAGTGDRVETPSDEVPAPIEENGDRLQPGRDDRTDPPVVEEDPPVEEDPSVVEQDPPVDSQADPTFVDATSTSIDISIGNNPYRVAAAGGQLWVMSLSGELARFDLTTLEQTADLAVAESSAMAATAEALWVADTLTGELVRVDPQSAAVVASIPTGIRIEDDIFRPTGAGMLEGPRRRFALIGGIDATDQAVWVGDHDGFVLEFDPSTDALVRRLEVGVRPDIVAVDGSHLVVGDYDTGVVIVYDTVSGNEVARFAPADRLIGATLHRDAAYVHDATTGVVHRVDLATGDLTSSEPLGEATRLTGLPVFSPGPIVGDAGVLVEANDEFVVLDPDSLREIGRFDVGGSGGEMTLDDRGNAWIVRYTRSTVTRIEATSAGS